MRRDRKIEVSRMIGEHKVERMSFAVIIAERQQWQKVSADTNFDCGLKLENVIVN